MRRDREVGAVLEVVEPVEAEAGGLLDGVAVGIKTNIAVAGHACHGGIAAYRDRVAERNALAVRRLRAAGADVVATLNMEEGALGAATDNPWFGRTHNPLLHGYTAGGSSGGSAAAVAAGIVDAALGTDTMGSVRIPSSYCGVFGFKPSHSRALLEGVMPLSPTLDTVGVHAASFDMLVRVAEVVFGQGLRSGIAGSVVALDDGGAVEVEPAIRDAFEAAARGLERVRLDPYAYGLSRRAGLLISEAEGWAVHSETLSETDGEGFSDTFRRLLEYGRDVPLERLDAAYAHLAELRRAAFPPFVLMPTAPQVAFRFGTAPPAHQADYTAFANLADRPAIQFPAGVDDDGLPVGLQIVGPRGGEADLVATVRAFLGSS